MKKIISIIVSICMLLCCFCISVSADSTDTYVDEQTTLLNLYTNSISTRVNKSGANIVYSCDVSGKSTATKISIYLYLQEYSNGTWKDVSAVSTTINGRMSDVSNIYSLAVSGKKYRTNAHVYVYSGSKYEYLEVNSKNVVF
jgi:hypothetical protein